MLRMTLVLASLAACGSTGAPLELDAPAPIDGPAPTPDAPILAARVDARPAIDAARRPDAPPPDAPPPDARPPDAQTLGVLAVSPDGYIGAHVAMTFTFTEPVASISVSVGPNAHAMWSLVTPTELVVEPTTSWTDGFLGVGLTAKDAAGHVLQWLSYFVVDAVAPSPTILSAYPTVTDAHENIVVRYSEPMLASSLVLGGSLATTRASWWTAFATNDTIELDAPGSGWPDGGSLTIDATDLAGNPSVPVSFTVQLGH
jgi:hypothetical protein